jgi:hypothetical protein
LGLLKERGLLWKKRFDDRVRAEGVSTQDYPMVFASRDAKTPFFLVVASYTLKGLVYSLEPRVGGGVSLFIQAELKREVRSSHRTFVSEQPVDKNEKQHLRKCGRGWLHK